MKKISLNKKQVPALQSRAAFKPDSLDEKNRTVELVWTTTEKCLREFWFMDPFYEVLSMDPAHCRMKRLSNGASVLNNHQQRDLSSVIGVVEKAWLEGNEGKAIVRFSERADVEPIFQDIKNGIIRHVSVGYRVHKYQDVTLPNEETRTLKAIDWEPHEISMVAVPADSNSTVRSADPQLNDVILEPSALEAHEIQNDENSEGEHEMKNKENNEPSAPASSDAGTETLSPEQAKAVADKAAKEEREKGLEIRSLCRSAKLDDSFADELVRKNVSLAEAQKQIIEKWSQVKAVDSEQPQAIAANPSVTVTRDATETFRKSVQEAILHRANPDKNKLTELGRNHGGLMLREVARLCLERQGVKTSGMGVMELVSKALHTSSDFPHILADAMNKSLRSAYEEAPKTFVPWASKRTVADFKNIKSLQTGNFPTLTKVNEAGEFKYSTISEGKEQYALATYGAIVGLSRQAIINDDLGAFDRIPVGCGQAAASLESDIVYGILTANAVLSDSVALFHATHKNYTGTGTEISVNALGVMRNLFAVQTGLDSRILNLKPKFLIVPAALQTKAEQFVKQFVNPSSAPNSNPFYNTLDLIVEGRLDSASTQSWYGAADKSQCAGVEYANLEGSEGVYTETRMGFEVDGVEIKARHDFAAKAVDHRGLYKNLGTTPT